MAEKRITKINIDGEEYSVGDGGGEELEKLKKYVRSTPDTDEGTSAQFGIFSDNHQTYIQIDSNKDQYNKYTDNITINNNGRVDNFSSTKPNIDINAKSVNLNAWDFLLNTTYGKICFNSDNKMIRIGGKSLQENENTNVLTLGRPASYCLKNTNVLFIGKNNGIQNVSNSIIVTDSSSNGLIDLKNSVIVGEDIEVIGQSGVMIGKGLKNSGSAVNYQIIFGQYNEANSNSIFQIGNGQGENAKYNLFEINKYGKAYLSTDGTGNLGTNGPGYVVKAPEEKENSFGTATSSCYPFMITSSSGGTTALFYKKQNTTITSSFQVKTSNRVVNSIELTSNEDGTKTVTLSDPSAWRSTLFTDSIKRIKRIKGKAINLSIDSSTIAEFNNLPKGIYLAIGDVFVEAIDTNGNSRTISNARVATGLFHTSEFARQTLTGTYLSSNSVEWNSINVCGITSVGENGTIYLRANGYTSDTTITIKAWGTLLILNLTDGTIQTTSVSD